MRYIERQFIEIIVIFVNIDKEKKRFRIYILKSIKIAFVDFFDSR